jgi:hypothetical protein
VAARAQFNQVARLRSAILPLALQQLDAVQRDHSSAGTDALAVIALDVGLGSVVVLWSDANRYPAHWWVPLIALMLSSAVALVSKLPIEAGRDTQDARPGRLGLRRLVSPLRAGLVPGAGPEVRRLATEIQKRPELEAYEYVIAAVLSSFAKSGASLRVKNGLITASLLLLVLDAATSGVVFLCT